MTDAPLPNFIPGGLATSLDPETCRDLLQMLRRKEQTWVDWGHACQQLQRSGYNSAQIFEETGFEPIQQNQVIVAAQIYESMLKAGLEATTQAYFQKRGSDVLYELRGLTPPQRSLAATFAYQHQFDLEQARELAKAYKDFARVKVAPEGFVDHPGDALAWQYWRWAKERSELSERSRFIVQGLKVAHSIAAREKLQELLTDWAPTLTQTPPRWPLYRLESGDSVPRILPLLGSLPLDTAQGCFLPENLPNCLPNGGAENPFAALHLTTPGSYVAVPGWSIIQKAQNPVAVQCQVADLPHAQTLLKDLDLRESEPLLLIIDPADRTWQNDRYFLVDRADHLCLEWLPTPPAEPGKQLFGVVLLVLRTARTLEISEADDGDWILAE